MYIDSHSHFADPRFSDSEIEKILENCREQKINLFLQGGINPTDWNRQLELKNKFPESFLLAFGLHPYFISENDRALCDAAMDELATRTHECIALGETGLDFREKYLGEDIESQKEKQITFFENHIALAKLTNLPIVMHVVQAHDEALRILKIWDPPQRGGFLHAFNGSFEVASEYIKMNFLISVGGAVTFEKNRKLREAVLKIPLENLLLESDSPDQAPIGWVGLNNSTSLWQIANEIAKIKEISPLKVLETTTSNFKRLFKM
jgi:TatD DNase family protein